MKKFLVFMMCLTMFCAGTVQAKEGKESKQPKIEQSCFDVGRVQQVQVIQFSQIPDIGQMVADSYPIGHPGNQGIEKDILQKDALYSQYRYIPNCPIEFTGRHKMRYITHYYYASRNTHNQPPSLA